jgi:hypothetical protein
MAGTTKDITPAEVHQGPGELWVIGTPPVDATPRLTLASDGTPDSATHGTCVHLGAIKSAITTAVKPKIGLIGLDQYEAEFDGYVTDLEATIEAEMAQTESAKLQRALGVGTYSTGSGYKQVTFGGNLAVPTACIAAISKKRVSGTKYIVATLFQAAAIGGFQVVFGRAKESSYKAKFQGLADLTRTAGKQLGVVHETLTDAAGGTPTAKDLSVNEMFQGTGDLWLIDAAPTDVATRVTIDAATLTPDATAHANAKHLGGTTGEITMTVTPKLGFGRMDQPDAPIYVFIDSLEAKIEAEMAQTEVQKLQRALGVGTYLGDAIPATTWKQVTFGGTDVPPVYCIAAIAKKRSDLTKAAVMCLYRVNSVGGIEITMSRKKQSGYKVSFTGLLDLTRTSGKQIGIFHEMI